MCVTWMSFPENARNYVRWIGELVGVRIRPLSRTTDRDQTIPESTIK